MKNNKITIYDYLAYQEDPESVIYMLKRYKYPEPKDQEDVKKMLTHFVKKMRDNGKGEEALKELAEVHPDRDIILEDKNNELNGIKKELKLYKKKYQDKVHADGVATKELYIPNNTNNNERREDKDSNLGKTLLITGTAMVGTAILAIALLNRR